MQWFDTHCHLDRLPVSLPLDQVVVRAGNAGVSSMVVPGITGAPGRLPELFSYSQAHLAWGVHPAFIDQTLLDLNEQEPWKGSGYFPVAIGECGLDRRSRTPLSRQLEIFTWQLRLAQHHHLPLLVHLVGHFHQAFELLTDFKPQVPLVMHSWSGSAEMAARFVKIGASISLSASCLRNPAKLVRLLKVIPLTSLLLETDSPDMPPPGWPNEHNEPAAIVAIASAIAKITATDIEKLAEVVYTKALRIFLPPERKHHG